MPCAKPDNKRLEVETRSIEQVPHEERHGQAWQLGPFWFTGNFVLTTMATGFIGPASGLAALHAIIAIVLGVALGTLCMALHANQGPRLGLAQMIQSRAQFGIRGAVLPFAVVVCVYIGFNVFNLTLASQALSPVVGGPSMLWQGLFLGVAMFIAIVGHDLLHTVQRWLTYLLIGVFGLLSISALNTLELDSVQPLQPFSWAVFIAQMSAAAAYQVSYAVYVSDYSRYLPSDTPARRVIGWTYLGAATSAIWLMSLGALASSALPGNGPISYVTQLGDLIYPGFGSLAVLLAVPALVGIMAVNCYGAMLTGASALTAFRPLRPGPGARIAGIGLVGLAVYLIAIGLPEGYLESFSLFLQMMLYFLLPWSAINLTDFYLLRKGRYVIADLFDTQGIYGRWALPGILAYAGALLAMLPLASIGDYSGWMVTVLGGVDLAAPTGFAVAALLYFYLTRQRDHQRETVLWAKENQS